MSPSGNSKMTCATTIALFPFRFAADTAVSSSRYHLGHMSHNIQPSITGHHRISRRKRAVMPHLGNFFLGGIYRTLTGRQRLSRPLFKRAVANGLHRDQLDSIYRRTGGEGLAPAMLSLAENHLQQALYWHDVGVKNRARDHYLEAALWEMYGALLLNDPATRIKALARSRQSYALGTGHFHYPTIALEIPYLGATLPGYLRLPVSQADENTNHINANHPCVLLFNGISTPKEELHFTENSFLALGMATLSFDYPFTDDTFEHLQLDAEELGNTLLLTLAARPEIDMSRLVAYGTSIGGRLALFVASHFRQRFRAVVSMSAPYDLLADLDLLLAGMQREMAASPFCARATIHDLERQTSLRGELEQIQAATLIVGGGKDIIAMPEETRLIYEQICAPDKKLIICPGANHNCYEMMPSLRHEIGQWIKQRL